jgi:hypothetical protein
MFRNRALVASTRSSCLVCPETSILFLRRLMTPNTNSNGRATYTTSLNIVVESEKLQFVIKEAIERKQHKPTKDELTRQKADT